MWLATGLGLTVGYHRLFAHRAFAVPTPIAALLLILGSMAARGPMISWAAIHAGIIGYPIRTADSHSPNLHGEGPGGRSARLAPRASDPPR